MRILKLHHPLGHPYWNEDEYMIQLPNMEEDEYFKFKNIPLHKIPEYAHQNIEMGGRHRIKVLKDGIYYQCCGSGSGTGKTDYRQPFKIIDGSEYDEIEFVGEKKEMY